jgi:hypothetical protein
LTYGRFEPIIQQHQSVIAYLRVLGNEKILVVADFAGKGAEIRLGFSVKRCIVSNNESSIAHNNSTKACPDSFAVHTDKLVLAPYDFFVYEV